ncbi:MAG: hypothetical protein KDD69_09110 [Bdellovibrionales bacterium]|nr:hypothetical protein [Bdellovibrionales bacterium]
MTRLRLMGVRAVRLDFSDGVLARILPIGVKTDLAEYSALLESIEVPSGTVSVTLGLSAGPKSPKNVSGDFFLDDGSIFFAQWEHESGRLAEQIEARRSFRFRDDADLYFFQQDGRSASLFPEDRVAQAQQYRDTIRRSSIALAVLAFSAVFVAAIVMWSRKPSASAC